MVPDNPRANQYQCSSRWLEDGHRKRAERLCPPAYRPLDMRTASFKLSASSFLCIVAVCFASYIILRLAAKGSRWISPTAMKITIRLMGLLLSAVAVQFILNTLKELHILGA